MGKSAVEDETRGRFARADGWWDGLGRLSPKSHHFLASSKIHCFIVSAEVCWQSPLGRRVDAPLRFNILFFSCHDSPVFWLIYKFRCFVLRFVIGISSFIIAYFNYETFAYSLKYLAGKIVFTFTRKRSVGGQKDRIKNIRISPLQEIKNRQRKRLTRILNRVSRIKEKLRSTRVALKIKVHYDDWFKRLKNESIRKRQI